jgi:DNA-binding transcriptional LysR family regulator
MNPELLDTFLDLAESRSFNRTAERLGVSQSTVSARIRALEAALGERLFTRSRAGTVPTAAGQRFEAHARTLRHAWAEARRAVARAGERAGALRIGLQHDLAQGHIADWVRTIRETFPKTELYVELDYSTQMSADVLSGALDLAVLYTPRPLPDLTYEPLGAARYLMVSTHATRLAEVDPARTIRASYAPAFDAAHRALHPALDAAPVGSGQNAAVAALLAALGGSAYVLAETAAELEASGTAGPVSDAPEIAQPVHAALHIRNRTNALHRRLVALAKRHFAAQP